MHTLAVPCGLVQAGGPKPAEVDVELGDQALPVKEVHLRSLRSVQGDPFADDTR
jgi:hypothetical protein